MNHPSDLRDYLVLGAGAIGGTLAHHLAAAGHPVTLVDTDTEHIAAIRRDGITLTRRDGERRSVPVAHALTPDEADAAGITARRVLLATKGHHTRTAMTWLAPHLAEDGFVVSCQNGDNEPVIAELIGHHRVVGAFVNLFADVVGPGVIRDGGSAAFVIGELDGTLSKRVTETVTDLRAWGPVRQTGNVTGYLWAKHGFAEMLTTTALVDAPMASTIDRHRGVVTAVAREVNRIAAAEGHRLERFDAYDPAAFTDRADPTTTQAALDRLVAWLTTMPKDRSGVWRDIAVRGRRTEVHLDLEGHIRRAETHGLPVPLLRRLDQMLTELETGQRTFADANVVELGQAAGTPAAADRR
ncbi:ketopantoate reductase family protein [Streptomyces sp. NEAU-Y11]|uniref:ketopantoate reductase family protein n=1 Tax=Streptomyces cucumeris TaxID=2962890 RepID=UPI0020C86402|nr:2-dehydropantoate 2-reductase N-terminal domain-containing protein [Streptomyces sp. NEAU-Y11]MCP9211548.1 NAD-binding protein [Streptomyces sp. NEAU-Y11]